jgi:hypothetical protein
MSLDTGASGVFLKKLINCWSYALDRIGELMPKEVWFTGGKLFIEAIKN